MAVNYTDEQKACVERLVGPVDVSAGAGSGKTFTLTQRIAAALANPESGVDDIDQVCAITFTEKAAAELKGRVRSTLRAQGMFEQALKVDGAWISTIHGMCSRILRGCALDLGIDPAFKVMDGKIASDEMRDCLNVAIDLSGGRDGKYASLFHEYRSTSAWSEASVESLVSDLLNAASGLRHGLDDIVVVTSKARPRDIARNLLEAYQVAQPYYLRAKAGKSNDTARENVQATIDALMPYVAGEGEDTVQALLDVLDECPLGGTLRAGDLKEAAAECVAAHQEAVDQALALLGDAMLGQLIDLARDAEALFAQRKRELACLDLSDLIRMTLDALERPEVLERFSDKFRLVMVDEFQDTDALQLAIVSKLSGPGMRYLCTVGDAQQSIYGFRGADINTYRRYQASLGSEELREGGGEPCKLQLSRNFRSHSDILAFVKKVCAQPCVFGDEFLDLTAHYGGEKYRATDEPRIQLSCSMLVPDGRKGSISDAIEVQAQEIAGYFERMHEGGHKLSEMVLLLGKVKYADVYAAAIRKLGYPCIIAGGSLFAQAAEVQVVNAVLQAIANSCNTQYLFAALSGPAFELSASDLLRLGTRIDEDTGRTVSAHLNRSIESGEFMRIAEAEGGALGHACATLAKARRSLRDYPLHQVLLQALQDSGWITRLQENGPEGMAALGNVMKAVRFVCDIQEENDFGVTRTAKHFDEMVVEGMREAPGALNLSGQEAIRIMTIHASKGLEFPVVALADFVRDSRASDLVVQRVEGTTFANLKAHNRTLAGRDISGKAFAAAKDDVDPAKVTRSSVECASAIARRAMLTALGDYEELAEEKRLFYVGATRAKEALGLFMSIKYSKSNPLGAYKSTVDDVRSAFFGEEAFDDDVRELDYGGSAPASFVMNRVNYADIQAQREAEAQANELPRGEIGTFAMPQVKSARRLDEQVLPREDSGLFSYSSLAHGDIDKGALREITVAGAVAGSGSFSRDDGSKEEVQGVLPTSAESVFENEKKHEPLLDASGDEGDTEDMIVQRFAVREAADSDKATDFGSALHRLCQIAALTSPDTARNRVEAMCQTYGVRDKGRLVGALERWLGSHVRTEALAFARQQPEVGFSVQVGDGVLEGEIDLLCTNGSSGHVLIVDYKTGGYDGETPEQLREKHGLQACCYAYATLMQGYDSVDLVFVRVERDDPKGLDTLDSIRFRYEAADKEKLCAAIASAKSC